MVLAEEESNGLVPIHVEGHLARLKVMLAKGEPISRLLWIVDNNDFRAMFDLLRFYSRHFGPLPPMELWDTHGDMLGRVNE